MKPTLTLLLLSTLLMLGMSGCGDKNSSPIKDEVSQAAVSVPKVTDDRADLVLSWYVDGGPEVGASVSDVPDGAKKEVRVQDPSIPPEKRDPEVVYIADLTKKGSDGGYAVKAVKRSEFEATRQAERDKAAKKRAEALAALSRQGTPSGTAPTINLSPGSAPPVVMYATKHCPVCVKARRWLLEKKIPYVEKDLESDGAAAVEVQKKGQAQGVSTNGVPIFEIGGRLLPGFDPARIVAMLVQGSGQQKNI